MDQGQGAAPVPRSRAAGARRALRRRAWCRACCGSLPAPPPLRPQTARYLARGGCEYRVTHVYVWNLESWDVQASRPRGCGVNRGRAAPPLRPAHVLAAACWRGQGLFAPAERKLFHCCTMCTLPTRKLVQLCPAARRRCTPSAPPARAAGATPPSWTPSTATTAGRREAAAQAVPAAGIQWWDRHSAAAGRQRACRNSRPTPMRCPLKAPLLGVLLRCCGRLSPACPLSLSAGAGACGRPSWPFQPWLVWPHESYE